MADNPFESLKRHVARELAKPNVGTAIRRVDAERSRRLVRRSSATVLTMSADASFPGSVILYFAAARSRRLRVLTAAFLSRDINKLNDLRQGLEEEVKARRVITIEDAVEQTVAAPVFFDIAYGHRTLATNMALINDVDVGILIFPYNGGALANADFSIYEYYSPGTSVGGYDVLIVKYPPLLTPLEQAVLSTVPEDQLEINIGPALEGLGICWAYAATVGLMIIAATLMHTVAMSVATDDPLTRFRRLSLSSDDVERLGARASAQELMNMRRRLFQGLDE
jgi:hypothetical protein